MTDYYDRDGQPITQDQWAAALMDFKRVAEDTLPDGKWVSTIWLGLDHRFGDGPPLIFETMVFPKRGEWRDIDCERYSTIEEARAGHAAMVSKYGEAK